MDLEGWLSQRTFHHSDFGDIAELVRLKYEQGISISLCFPTLNEAKTIGKEIKVIRRELMKKYPLIDEIGIVDSGSTDRTTDIARKQGATVYKADECLPGLTPIRGKGENLWKSLYLFRGDIIVWVDADIRNIHPRFVYGLVGPLLKNPEIGYVKAFYRRPLKVGRKMLPGGGRVTELLVRPFLSLLFPELSMLAQPLSGEYAGRRNILERLPFFTGYGVEIGLLLDIEQRFGIQSIAQVDMDVRVHRNQDLNSLRRMSYAILLVLITRCEQIGKLALLEGLGQQLNLIKKEGTAYIHGMEEVYGKERPPMVSVPEYQNRHAVLEESFVLLDSRKSNKSFGDCGTQYIKESLIALELESSNRDSALGEMLDLYQNKNGSSEMDRDIVLRRMVEREKKMSTNVGHGVAVPHLLTDYVSDPVVVLGRSRKGIPFSGSIIRRPVHVVILILAPANDKDQYLEILSRLAGLLRHRRVVQKIMAAKSEAEVVSVIKKYETVFRLNAELGIRALV